MHSDFPNRPTSSNFHSEIRVQIYRLVIPLNQIIDVDSPEPLPSGNRAPSPHLNSILLLNKQISDEALDLLFSDNIFEIFIWSTGETTLERKFPAHHLQRMRSIVITAGGNGDYLTGKNIPDMKLWRWILPNLRNVRFVAKEPVAYHLLESGYGFTGEMQEVWRKGNETHLADWIEWIGAVVEFFEKGVQEDAVVEVDVDGRDKTREVFERILKGRFNEVRDFEVGDRIFLRGRFAMEDSSDDDMCCCPFD